MGFRKQVLEDGQKFLNDFLSSSPEEQKKIFWLLEGIRIGRQMDKPEERKERQAVG